MIKASLRIENDVAHGVARSGADGPLALRVAGQTADGVADAIMKADKPLGVEVLVASTQGKFCMSQPARNTFFKALAEPHTVLVYDRPQKVLAILVPTQGVVLIASGEG